MMSLSIQPARQDEAGFSLIELLISMALMLIVLAGTMQMMSTAMDAQKTGKQVLDMNSQLRAAIDLVQRDLLQTAQGLPDSRTIGIPNGAGMAAIDRPGPAAADDCPGVDTFGAVTALAAVTVGPGLGPAINGECTDVVTVLSADNTYGPVPVTAIADDGSTATMLAEDPNALDVLRVGDLLMLRKGSSSVLMQITAVEGNTVTFGTGALDPLGLNQFTDPAAADEDDGPFNTINQFKATAPFDNDVPDDGPDENAEDDSFSDATRVRMLTYFVDTETDPRAPRLMRALGGAAPAAVGLGVDAFRITYDLVGDVATVNGVAMNSSDLDGSGACSPAPCAMNQIRKMNIVLSMKSFDPRGAAGDYEGNHTQNTLRTQVSLRSMAFVDRYR
jgi:prepilin-type N-terminal cleavage/methylation domain-containing protein